VRCTGPPDFIDARQEVAGVKFVSFREAGPPRGRTNRIGGHASSGLPAHLSRPDCWGCPGLCVKAAVEERDREREIVRAAARAPIAARRVVSLIPRCVVKRHPELDPLRHEELDPLFDVAHRRKGLST
jgi:hypothetical protein